MRSPKNQTFLSLAALSVALIISNAVVVAKPTPVAVTVSSAARAALTAFLAENPGTTAHALTATGSMKPHLDENWIVIMSAQDFWGLRPGDVIAYRCHEGEEVLHRVTTRVGWTGFRIQGDAQRFEDNTLVRERDYIATAVAAVHRASGELKTLNKRIADNRERLAANPPAANR